jgi:ribonucleotide monophosphatase NagD (HAD superfamily)
VGDRLGSDLAGAAAAKLDCAIVLTGASTREQAQAATDPEPVAIADTLHALVTGEDSQAPQ